MQVENVDNNVKRCSSLEAVEALGQTFSTLVYLSMDL